MLGMRAAEYIDFLQSNVPDGMGIVLPYGVGEFTQQSLLQFFLMPHPIPGCGCGSIKFEEVTRGCVMCLRDENHAVPAIGPFPPVRAVQEVKVFIANPTDTGWFHGVYLTKILPDSQVEESRLLLLAVAAIDLLLILGLFVLGSLVVDALMRQPAWSDLVPLGWPLGMGLLTFSVCRLGVRASLDPVSALGNSLTLSSGQACLHGARSDLGLEASRMAGIGSCCTIDNGCSGDLRWKGYSTFDGIAN